MSVGNVRRKSVHNFICGGNVENVQRFWKQIFKELNDICGKDIELNPEIAFLSKFKNVEYDKMIKELITNLLTAARLIIARQWKSKSEFQMDEWYNEIWNIAINDKLTCNLKVKKGELKKNIFMKYGADSWNMY